MLFIDNKYTNWYLGIISLAQKRIINGYTERHHIIPKSLGGTESDINKVILTAREHFICHLLLVRMTTGDNKRKMQFAIHRMCHGRSYQDRHIPTSTQYNQIRKQCAEAQRGEGNPNWRGGRQRDNKGYPGRTYWLGKKRPYQNRTVTTFGDKNANAKQVVTPLGHFTTLKAAAKAHHIGPDALRARIKKIPESYSYSVSS